MKNHKPHILLIILLLIVSTASQSKEQPGTLIYTAANFNLTTGNTYDLLNLIPQVEVADDGTISILGNGQAKVMIDNREASPGGNYQPILEQLSLDMIKHIKVITSPSASNDAEAGGGVVDIIMAGEGLEGYSATVVTKAGTGGKYNANAGINYMKGKWDFKLNALTSRYRSTNNNYIYTENYYPDDTILTTQHIDNILDISRLNTNISLGYSINDYHSLRLLADWGSRDILIDSDINSISTDASNTYTYLNRRHDDGKDMRYTLEHKALFNQKDEPKKELSTNISYYTALTSSIKDLQFVYDDVTNSDFNHLNAQVDYSQDFASQASLETGGRSYRRTSRMNYNRDSVHDGEYTSILKDDFRFEENVHAGYAQYSNSLSDFNTSWGLRAEYSTVDGEQILESSSFHHRYLHWFPSVQVAKPIATDHKLTFNYNRSIQRPRNIQMNPFVNDMNPNNLQFGNPELRPALSNNIELKYEGSADFADKDNQRHNWSLSLYLRSKRDHIYRTTLPSPDEQGVMHNTFYNLKEHHNIGIEALYSVNIFHWWQLDLTPRFSHIYNDGTNISPDILSTTQYLQVRLKSNITLWEGSRLLVSSFYRTAHDTPQGQQASFARSSFTLNQNLFKDKLTLTLTAKDPFNQAHYYTYVEQDDFIQDREFDFEGAVYEISLRFNLGAMQLSGKESATEERLLNLQ